MQFTLIALTAALSTLTAAAPQIDFGCTLSCGVWNACRVRAVAEGNPLTDCGAEPDQCNCQQFADLKAAADAAPVAVRAPEPQVDFGCTLSCGVWNACRVRAVADGEPLTQCGAEPDKCNCQQFADFKRETAAPAPVKRAPEPQVDFGCTLSCGVWNACRVRAVADGEPLTQCGAEPDKCNCQQFADFKREAAAPAPVKRVPEPQVDFGCTLSCGVWNACRVRAVADGEPLTQCGAEPDKCNCQQFADFKREAAAPAPAPVKRAPEPQVDFGCTLSCGVWNACRVRAVADGEPLTQCGAEPDKCNCQQFADFKA